MKNVIISILIILIIVIMGLFMLTTCPKEQDHKDAICLAINKAVDEKLGDSSLSFAGVINYGSKFAIKQIASLFIDSLLDAVRFRPAVALADLGPDMECFRVSRRLMPHTCDD